MDANTIDRLIELDNEFYRENARSFSDTRSCPWEGWPRVIESLPSSPASVLDVACGNMRFKTFLNQSLSKDFAYLGIDSCAELVPSSEARFFKHIDLLSQPLDPLGQFHFVACFGFLHHVPTVQRRKELLDYLFSCTAPGGTLALSFWQFARNDKLLSKALSTTESGCEALGIELDENDYLLGWQNEPGRYRYCHSFTDAEIDDLIACTDINPVDRFRADGKSGNLNTYVVLRNP